MTPESGEAGGTTPPGEPTSPAARSPTSIVLRHLRRLLVLVVGGTLLVLGVILVFLPGPALVVIPLALALLATEFVWARHLLKRARALLKAENEAESIGDAHREPR